MPLFGGKKQESKKEKGGSAYPSQPAYPTQGAYPTQPSAPAGVAGAPPPYAPPQQPGAPAAQPPSYSYPAPQQGQGYAPPPQQQPVYYPTPGPQYGYAPQYGAAAYPAVPPGAHVVGHGQFDAGARFNSGAGMNIPPPPPGCMPNAAQVAAIHGGTVQMTQAKAGIFSSPSDGGVSTHID